MLILEPSFQKHPQTKLRDLLPCACCAALHDGKWASEETVDSEDVQEEVAVVFLVVCTHLSGAGLAILSRESAILLYLGSAHICASRCGNSGDSRPAILGIVRFVDPKVPQSGFGTNFYVGLANVGVASPGLQATKKFTPKIHAQYCRHLSPNGGDQISRLCPLRY